MKTTFKNLRIAGVALFALLSIATVSRANDENKQDKRENKIELKYLGKRDNQSIFKLNLNVPQGEEYIIYFRDNLGYVLYTTVVNGNFSQNYAINTEEIDNTVSVEIRSKKTRKSENFTIKRNQLLVDETIVAKS